MPLKSKNILAQTTCWSVPRLLIASMIWLLGFIFFISSIPNIAKLPSRSTDGIVVLTGGQNRLSIGLYLLDKKFANSMLISGMAMTTEKTALLSQLNDLDKKRFQAQEDNITLGYIATNTYTNAAEADMWRQLHDYKSLTLVTGNYHMTRSLFEFQQMMPDCLIVPYPVISEAVHLNDFWNFPNSLLLLANEYNKFLALLIRYGWNQWVNLFP